MNQLIATAAPDPNDAHVVVGAIVRAVQTHAHFRHLEAELAAHQRTVRLLGELIHSRQGVYPLGYNSISRMWEAMQAVFNDPIARAAIEKRGGE